MEALKQVPADIYILASPQDCAGPFGPLAEEAGFRFCPGPKEDVLGRYCLAIRRFSLGRVIRATGDNPFVFAAAAAAITDEALKLGADYAAYSGLPYGAGVEFAAAAALLRAEAETSSLPQGSPEREHVCPYLYGRPDRFLLHRPLAPRPWQGPSLRITVDTREDYDRCLLLWEALKENTLPREEAAAAAWRSLAGAGHPLFKGQG
jgi:spore coat polysaccharide biosynthesis protein SpsF